MKLSVRERERAGKDGARSRVLTILAHLLDRIPVRVLLLNFLRGRATGDGVQRRSGRIRESRLHCRAACLQLRTANPDDPAREAVAALLRIDAHSAHPLQAGAPRGWIHSR